MNKFIIKCYGCSRRDLDAERISNYLLANGLKRTDSAEEADHLIVVTCGLTKEKSDNSVRCISEFQKHKGKTFVYGCLPAMDPEKIKSVYDDAALLTKDIERLDEFMKYPVRFKDTPDANRAISPLKRRLSSLFEKPAVEGVPGGIGFNNKLFTLRIAEGCAANCSFCTIKNAIGRV